MALKATLEHQCRVSFSTRMRCLILFGVRMGCEIDHLTAEVETGLLSRRWMNLLKKDECLAAAQCLCALAGCVLGWVRSRRGRRGGTGLGPMAERTARLL